MKPNVFIVNRGCHDFSPAEEYGTLIFLTEGSFSRFQTGKMFRVFREKLKDSSPEDLIVISGMTVMTVVACAMFVRKHGRLNLLLHVAGPNVEEAYVKRTIVMEDI